MLQVRDATAFGPNCVQTIDSGNPNPDATVSEDCKHRPVVLPHNAACDIILHFSLVPLYCMILERTVRDYECSSNMCVYTYHHHIAP
jgi:hypothetical protein